MTTLTQGITATGQSLAYDAPKYEMAFGEAERLGVFGQYKFFTPALLYLFGRFFDGPLVDFIAEFKTPDTLYLYHRFERPIFANFRSPGGPPDWNHVLWAMPVEHWPAFEAFMLSLSFRFPDDRVYRVGVQDVTIHDPLAVDKARVVLPGMDTLPVAVFGVDSSVGVVAVHDAWKHPAADALPAAAYFPPQVLTRVFADAVTRDDPGAALDALGTGLPRRYQDELRRADSLPPLAPVALATVDLAGMPESKRREYINLIRTYKENPL